MGITYRFMHDWALRDQPLAEVSYLRQGPNYLINRKELFVLFKDYLSESRSTTSRTSVQFREDLEEVGISCNKREIVDKRKVYVVKLSNEIISKMFERMKVKLEEGIEFRIIDM